MIVRLLFTKLLFGQESFDFWQFNEKFEQTNLLVHVDVHQIEKVLNLLVNVLLWQAKLIGFLAQEFSALFQINVTVAIFVEFIWKQGCTISKKVLLKLI